MPQIVVFGSALKLQRQKQNICLCVFFAEAAKKFQSQKQRFKDQNNGLETGIPFQVQKCRFYLSVNIFL